jgi:hypothetical protein
MSNLAPKTHESLTYARNQAIKSIELYEEYILLVRKLISITWFTSLNTRSSSNDDSNQRIQENISNGLNGSTAKRPNSTQLNEDFLPELRLQHTLTLDNKMNIEGKANNIITIAGTSATLLFGFAAFLADTSKIDELYLSFILVLLSLAISACVTSIILSVIASRIRKYRFHIVPSEFYDDKGELKTSIFWENFSANKRDFHEAMASGYLNCIKQNTQNNEQKAKYVIYAQLIFFIGILIIPILLIFLIFGLK